MATIQCAIELYDGVSPVLQGMGNALEGFSGKLEAFGQELYDLQPDPQGLALFGTALGRLAGYGAQGEAALGGVLESAQGIFDLFSQDLFFPFVEEGANATQTVGEQFSHMQGEITRETKLLGAHIAQLARGLPGHFAGPLAQIAGMFSQMASSAATALNQAMGGVQTGVMQAGRQGAINNKLPSPIAPLAAAQTISPLAMAAQTEFDLSPSTISLLGDAPAEARVLPPITVYVQNENHIASTADADYVLAQLEDRLVQAVACSMEGVYA